MIFNIWRTYKWFKPKKSGWYQCTTAHGAGLDQPKVLDLYFLDWDEKWIDTRRQSVFDGYKVYDSGHAPLDDYRVYTDTDCERVDVTAWRKLPRYYGYWKKKHSKSYNAQLWEEMDGR